eukprot:tig00021374_g21085.t1
MIEEWKLEPLVNVGLRAGDRIRSTPLHLAVEHSPGLVRALLQIGADPFGRDATGATALHVACALGRLDAAQALLEAASRAGLARDLVSVADSAARTPLHIAVDSLPGLVVALLKAGANPTCKDGTGSNALQIAWRLKRAEAEEALLAKAVSAGLDSGSGSGSGSSSESESGFGSGSSSSSGSESSFGLVYGEGGDPALLLDAICIEEPPVNSELVAALVEAGVDPLLQDERGDTALHIACRQGEVNAARALLEAVERVHEGPASISCKDLLSATDSEGRTPLRVVVDDRYRDRLWQSSNHLKDLVATLLEAGADLFCKDAKGATALHVACTLGRADAAQALLEAATRAGSAMDLLSVRDESDEAGRTPLQLLFGTIGIYDDDNYESSSSTSASSSPSPSPAAGHGPSHLQPAAFAVIDPEPEPKPEPAPATSPHGQPAAAAVHVAVDVDVDAAAGDIEFDCERFDQQHLLQRERDWAVYGAVEEELNREQRERDDKAEQMALDGMQAEDQEHEQKQIEEQEEAVRAEQEEQKWMFYNGVDQKLNREQWERDEAEQMACDGVRAEDQAEQEKEEEEHEAAVQLQAEQEERKWSFYGGVDQKLNREQWERDVAEQMALDGMQAEDQEHEQKQIEEQEEVVRAEQEEQKWMFYNGVDQKLNREQWERDEAEQMACDGVRAEDQAQEEKEEEEQEEAVRAEQEEQKWIAFEEARACAAAQADNDHEEHYFDVCDDHEYELTQRRMRIGRSRIAVRVMESLQLDGAQLEALGVRPAFLEEAVWGGEGDEPLLHFAARKATPAAVRALLRAGADPCLEDEGGFAALKIITDMERNYEAHYSSAGPYASEMQRAADVEGVILAFAEERGIPVNRLYGSKSGRRPAKRARVRGPADPDS